MREGIVKPTIKICYSKRVEKSDIDILLNGIEEEGIPFELIEKIDGDVIDLSYEACITSSLGVGIGVSVDKIALHFEKLEKASPLFVINIDSKKDNIRSIGANAARLVKKMPFKKIQI